jgi:hypothetical protein
VQGPSGGSFTRYVLHIPGDRDPATQLTGTNANDKLMLKGHNLYKTNENESARRQIIPAIDLQVDTPL